MVVVSLQAKEADARPFGVNMCHVVFDDALEPLTGDPRADAGSCRESAWEPVRSATRGHSSCDSWKFRDQNQKWVRKII